MIAKDASPQELRQRAEEKVCGDDAAVHPLSPEETERLIYELRVHQVELEMQNEELHRTHHDLAAAKDRYFELYDLAPVGYLTLSPAGIIREANLTAAALLGVTRKDLLHRPFTDFILPQDQEIYYRQRKRSDKDLQAGSTPANREQGCELRLKRPDNTVFWGQLHDSLVASDELRLTLTDITERKQAEEEKAKFEAQLQQAQKLEAVGRLAGGVAHDFNNMLGVIIGHAELALMKMEPSQPNYTAFVEIKKAAERSASLTRQLLAFARKDMITPRVLDLNETIAGMNNMLGRLIGENIKLTWQPGAALWPIKADPSQLDQIFANLCVNARDAISDIGTLTIETANCTLDKTWCAAHIGSTPGDYVRISVRDNGCGMSREVLEHVFEPFFTTKEVGKGTGLGLAMVFGAIKQNDGCITVESTPGAGTTFTIYLPRHFASSGQVQPEAATQPVRRGHETILLVEDEPTVLDVTKMMLENQGYTVLAASTPGKAMSLAREHAGEIQLLLTDVIMPEMNGRDLAKNLLSLYPHLKRLFMSGYNADVIAHHGVLAEGVCFIQKPIRIDELTAKVRQALDGE